MRSEVLRIGNARSTKRKLTAWHGLPLLLGSRRPYYHINSNLVKVSYKASAGDDNFNSRQVRLGKRTSGGLNFGLSYTYGKYLTDAGGSNGGGNSNLHDSTCIRCNYGPAPDDLRHNLVFNHVYDLPFGHGRKLLSTGPASYLVGGWNLRGVGSFHSGSPFTPTYALNVSNSAGAGSQLPNRIASGKLSTGQSINHWSDTSAFVAPAPYTFGTGILIGPGYFDVDLALVLRFTWRDRYGPDLKGEAFNTFNRANFDT